jgi:tRNA-guanine family transglycosylase
VCRRFSRAYLRHLYVAGEILAMRLNTLHNLHQYADLMRRARAAIEAGRYAEFASEFRSRWTDDRPREETSRPRPRRHTAAGAKIAGEEIE